MLNVIKLLGHVVQCESYFPDLQNENFHPAKISICCHSTSSIADTKHTSEKQCQS